MHRGMGQFVREEIAEKHGIVSVIISKTIQPRRHINSKYNKVKQNKSKK